MHLLHLNKRELCILCYRTSPNTLTRNFWIFMYWFCIKYLATFSNQDCISCVLFSKSMHLKDLFNSTEHVLSQTISFSCAVIAISHLSLYYLGGQHFGKVFHTSAFLKKKACVTTVSYLATTLQSSRKSPFPRFILVMST